MISRDQRDEEEGSMLQKIGLIGFPLLAALCLRVFHPDQIPNDPVFTTILGVLTTICFVILFYGTYLEDQPFARSGM